VQSEDKVKIAQEIVKMQKYKYYAAKQSQLIQINENTINNLRPNPFDIYVLIFVERMNRNYSINSSN
jgi:hypothetical protein